MTNSTYLISLNEEKIFTTEMEILRKFIYHIWICIAIFGLISNSINIIVFLKIGLRDNVTITLLFLSVSDLINLCLNSPRTVGRFMQENIPDHPWPFNFYIIVLGPYWYAYVFYDYSSFISVFLAGVRCACVARPLRFKSMFTKTRTLTILCALHLIALALSIPVLTVFRLTRAINPRTNSTYRSISFASSFTPESQNVKNGNDEKKPEKMSAKDFQVIQSVTLICVIFILSQLPFQVVSTVRLVDPEFTNYGKREFLYGFMSHVSNTFGYLNASVNILVHFHFNFKYRENFLRLFAKKVK